ncbi:unnamed protein product [Caenorhabditis auriculariae]|uniref:Tetratricopeptide repeat protein 5 OB fold domain-containing protein n=1 Tax=Caenorhabditis auriculariae TaxID=2777116 RepID=A0A8S1HPB2_9PELO|nr:unnamed protein product [Caenorhabditis auriculariae]
MTRGNQRDLAREKNLKKLQEQKKRAGANAKDGNAGLSTDSRMNRDAEIMRIKQEKAAAKKAAEDAAKGSDSGKVAKYEINSYRIPKAFLRHAIRMSSPESLATQLAEFRDKFAELHPESSEEDECCAVRQRAVQFIRAEIPAIDEHAVPVTKAAYFLACGRLLNVSHCFDPVAEVLLSSAVKLDPLLHDAWFELGQCLTKKPDIEFAVSCFEESIRLQKSGNVMSAMAVALRSQASRCESDAEKTALRTKALTLAREAVVINPTSGNGYLALATGCFVEFFSSSQTKFPFLDESIKYYGKALQCPDQTRNPELHLNFATALRYREDFGSALQHLKEAVKLDPRDSLNSRQRLTALVNYLEKFSDAVEKKGRLKMKRLQTLVAALQASTCAFIQSSEAKNSLAVATKSIDDLQIGPNLNTIIHAKIVATIPHDDIVPLTFVVCDVNERCCAVTVYNCAPNFGFVIGDTIDIAEPFLKEAENIELSTSCDATTSPTRAIPLLRWIRVRSPRLLCRNGQPTASAVVAPTQLTIES